MEKWIADWQTALVLAGCEQCDWLFLLPPDQLPLVCPHCAQADLAQMDETADKPIYTRPPELTLPYRVDTAQAQQKLRAFAQSAWFAPPDLKAERLTSRLHPVYLPLWLVDADVRAQWQAEMGFDYQVVSHKEEYRGSQWHTRQVKETRTRWEPRLGRLQRHFNNRFAPALEEQAKIEARLGRFEWQGSRPYQPNHITHALVRLPNRPPDDAWPEAQQAFMQAAGEECRQAAAANHSRQYKWQPHFSDIHWTQLLYPIYTSTYTDDEGETHTIYIHGQTGNVVGRRKASMKKARRWSLGIGAVGGVLLTLSFIAFLVGLVYAQVMAATAVLFIAGLITAAAAFLPILYAWYLNNYSDGRFEPDLAKSPVLDR